jgi:hypothetical protein
MMMRKAMINEYLNSLIKEYETKILAHLKLMQENKNKIESIRKELEYINFFYKNLLKRKNNLSEQTALYLELELTEKDKDFLVKLMIKIDQLIKEISELKILNDNIDLLIKKYISELSDLKAKKNWLGD